MLIAARAAARARAALMLLVNIRLRGITARPIFMQIKLIISAAIIRYSGRGYFLFVGVHECRVCSVFSSVTWRASIKCDRVVLRRLTINFLIVSLDGNNSFLTTTFDLRAANSICSTMRLAAARPALRRRPTPDARRPTPAKSKLKPK